MKFCFETKNFIEINKNLDKLAVIGENRTLTWEQFSKEVNTFCQFLREHLLENSESPVIIFGHKNAEMVVAMYACMKLNITYIPIDEVYPEQRIERVKEIAKVQLIINTSDKRLNLADTTEIVLAKKASIDQKSNVTQRTKTPENPLVYIIFTSGSTGEPKGVQICTEAVRSFTTWIENDFRFTENDVFINVALFSFDLSVYELMTLGKLGATIVLNGKNSLENSEIFLDRIQKYAGTIWISTPSFAFVYSRMAEERIANNIKSFLFCGEVLTNNLAKNLLNSYPTARVLNTYGPTEATVATSLIEITKFIAEKYSNLPVGFVKPGTEIRLDNEEIVIIGPNVSQGYLNREDLNKEKFGKENGTRFFKTGDNGFFENGMLFCKGRNDDQVKLHGYRIELNEITAKIDEIPFVVKSATLALKRNDEVKKIVSLVELSKDYSEDFKSLIQQNLKEHLPEYMIPSDVKRIENMPLNQNGKVDKAKLLDLYLSKG